VSAFIVARGAVGLLLIVCASCVSAGPDTAIGEANRSQCPRDGKTYLQVLGSGGPMHAEGRGGSAYALWISGRPAIVVDMGADTPTVLVRAGAAPASVDVLLLSHLHADHVSGLADFLWGEAAAERQQPLAIAGPDSNSPNFPSLPDFLERLIGAEGAFPTLKGLQTGAPFALQLTTLPVADPTPQRVLEHGSIAITALSVPHGAAPALAYRLEGPHVSVVFAGDQSGLHPRFAEFASGTDLLIFHATVNDRANDHRLAGIVGVPSRLGELARASGAKRVVLSHLMGQPGDSEQAARWSLSDIEGVVQSVRRAYQGPVALAADFGCLPL
jgi:ribonuclease BN (tRNA processing enzyme)